MGKAGDLKALLAKGIAEIGFDMDSQGQRAILAYFSLLKRWNRVYNLTRVNSDADFLARHLLDSLSVVPYLYGKRLIDVGTGAGMPGILLSIACPDMSVTLLDSNAKRCRFLRQVQAQLKLENVTVVQRRAEKFHPPEKFDCVISRAFSSMLSFIDTSGHLLARDGKLLAMKGQWPGDEAGDLTPGFGVEAVIKLNVPGLQAERHLVICKKT